MKLTYDDVLIEPNYSTVNSRSEVNLSSHLGNGLVLKLPIISSNMDTITESEMCKAMHKAGGIGCFHRFDLKDKTLPTSVPYISSFGLGEEGQRLVEEHYSMGQKYFCLDVAHGAQKQVVDQVKWFRKNIKNMWLMVGNFASPTSIQDFFHALEFEEYPNGIKIGVGPGSACTTRIKTGVGYPQISAISEINRIRKARNPSIKIIADGGMRTSGDIAKALAAGADAVMLGGMLAGTDETPPAVKILNTMKRAPTMTVRFPEKIPYRGSASSESYKTQQKAWSTAEGESFLVDYKGPVQAILNDIEGGLKSAFSYVGAKNLQEFHEKAKLIEVSPSTGYMNSAHGRK